jgi:hypothetical protein
MSLSGAETELKLALSPSVAESVFSLPALKRKGVAQLRSRRLVTTYYETPEKDLARRGVSLRIRQENDKRIQTVRQPATAASPIPAANGNGRSNARRLILGASKMRQSQSSSPMCRRTDWSPSS